MKFKDIEAKVFAHKNERTTYTEAIDGGQGYRPVSGWVVYQGHYDFDTDTEYPDKWVLAYDSIFNSYDGWDSDRTVEGLFNTYNEAVMSAYILDLRNENYDLKQKEK